MMNEWPVGLSTGCFYQTSIFECLGPIRHAGFNLIEICSFPAHLDYHDSALVEKAADAIRDHGLEPYSFHAPFADHIDLTATDPNRRRQALQEILRAADSAARMGAHFFVIHPGPEKDLSDGEYRLKRMENAVAALNTVADHCHAIGVKLVFENMLPHLSFGPVRDLLWILGALDSADIGICLDTGHAFLTGEIETVVQKLSGHLWMIHASDNGGKFDDHFPPGTGSINWAPLLNQIASSGFRGAVILEIAGNGAMHDILHRAQLSRQFLRDLAHRIDLDQSLHRASR